MKIYSLREKINTLKTAIFSRHHPIPKASIMFSANLGPGLLPSFLNYFLLNHFGKISHRSCSTHWSDKKCFFCPAFRKNKNTSLDFRFFFVIVDQIIKNKFFRNKKHLVDIQKCCKCTMFYSTFYQA